MRAADTFEILVRDHVAHIGNSPQFAGAPKLTRFLAFVVETVLAGQGDQIKESLIAIEVYGRRPDYNPQIDSTVRVEAGRLRARLRQYYEINGQDQPLEIELPKGTYVPVFHKRSRNRDVPRSRPRVVVAAAVILVAALMTGGLYRGQTQEVAVADPTTMEKYLRAYELLRIPVLREGVVPSVPATVIESVRLFEEVTRQNSRFARGWVGLAEANEWLYEIDKNHPPDRLSAAKAAALHAIDLDPNLAEAWTILTSLLFFREWDIPGAEVASRRAMKLNARDTLATQRYVDILRLQGRHAEALREVTRAAGIQPSTPNLRNRKALLLLESGQLEDAREEAMAAETVNFSKQQMAYTQSLWIQAIVHQRQGRLEQAEALFRKAIDHQPHDPWSEPSLAHLLALTGRRSEALQILVELQRQLDLGRPHRAAIALVQIGLGQYAEGIASLERGFVERNTAVLFAGLDERFAPLRSNPGFQTLLARIAQVGSGFRAANDSQRALLGSRKNYPIFSLPVSFNSL